MSKYIDHRLDTSFPKALVWVGYPLILIGIGFLIAGNWAAIIFVILGVLFSFTFDGITIDKEGRRVRKYTQFFGYKEGKWESLDQYPYISVLKRDISSATFSQSNRAMVSTNTFIDICLLDKTHHQKIVVRRYKKDQGASEEAQEYANLLGIELVEYSPYVSESTRNRRYRR